MAKASVVELVYSVCSHERKARDFSDAKKAAVAYAQIEASRHPVVILTHRMDDGTERGQYITGITSINGRKNKWVSEHAPEEFQQAYQTAMTEIAARAKTQGMGM